MATINLSDYRAELVPSAKNMKFGIVVSDWNSKITHKLLNGARNTLLQHGARDENIYIRHVPGSFELTCGGLLMAETKKVDAIILLGCVIKGETPHFDYICQGVTQGITKLNLEYSTPCIFGVLTTNDEQQALDRAGGRLGNKGDEAAITAIKMAALAKEMRDDAEDIFDDDWDDDDDEWMDDEYSEEESD
jgi:6,7-dimethyl-8-ribityllumazine synthase